MNLEFTNLQKSYKFTCGLNLKSICYYLRFDFQTLFLVIVLAYNLTIDF
jgi:hypothetical protein